jgi:hypothetical protein
MLIFLCCPIFAATLEDLSTISKQYLEKKSQKEKDSKWFKKYKSSLEQAISDNPVMNEQIFFSDRVLSWAIEKKKQISNLEEIDNETLIEGCRYFSLLIANNLELPVQIRDELKPEYLDKFVEFIRKKKDEA